MLITVISKNTRIMIDEEDERLKAVFLAVRAPRSHVNALRSLSDEIARAVTTKWGGDVTLQAFGSCICGVALSHSDVDLNLQVPPWRAEGKKWKTIMSETAALIAEISPGVAVYLYIDTPSP